MIALSHVTVLLNASVPSQEVFAFSVQMINDIFKKGRVNKLLCFSEARRSLNLGNNVKRDQVIASLFYFNRVANHLPS